MPCAARNRSHDVRPIPNAKRASDAVIGRTVTWAEFAEALLDADVAVVTDVYGAREEPKPGVSGKLIVDGILRMQKSKAVVYLPRLGSVVDYLELTTMPGDLVLTLGAGDVHRVGERFLQPV